MRYAIIGLDKPNSQDLRNEVRNDHLTYIDDTGVVEQAGPLLDDNGNMCGSLIILDALNREDAEGWVEDDPYSKAGLFQTVTVIEWKKVI